MTINNPVNAKVQGLQNFNSSSGVWTGRTLTSSDSSITITNADGTAGNPNLVVNGGKIGETITGDTGGPLSPTAGNWNIIANNSARGAGATVLLSGSVSTLTLKVSDGNLNTYIGDRAGVAGSGTSAGVALGSLSLSSITAGSSNTAIGANALRLATNSSNTTAIGTSSLSRILTGQNNTCLGVSSGNNFTSTESNNIMIQNIGTVGDDNTIRIGAQGSGAQQQNRCFIAGIAGVTTSNSNFVTIDTTTGQLGTNAASVSLVLDGDIGTATGSTINVITGNSSVNSGSSILFSGSGSTLTLNVSDGSANTIIGNNAGALGITGASNTGLGSFSLNALTIGGQNACLGKNTLLVGTSANNNTAAGYASLSGLSTGAFNTCLGVNSGSSYVGAESSNIIIGNVGTVSESNVIRIGTQGSGSGQQNTCFVAGITGVTTSNTNLVTIDTTTGQLGAMATPSSSIIIDGDTGTATGSTITIFASQATANAGQTVLFSASGSTVTFDVTDVDNNTCIGISSGALMTGSSNTALGQGAGVQMNSQNVAIGAQALNQGQGSGNTCVGQNTMVNNAGVANFNTCIGQLAGADLATTESSNIMIAHRGIAADNHTIRIGTQGSGSQEQNLCFIAGITGVTTSNSNFVTIDTTTGQLGASASGGSLTLTGDTGTASGTSLTVFTNQTSNNSGASVLFSNSGTTSTLNVTDSRNNTFIGKTCGNTTLTGNSNIGLGSNLLTSLTTGTNNVAVGRNNLNLCTTGSNNGAFSDGCLENLVTGNGNTALGNGAGSNYTSSESNNIVIGNTGTIADSAVTRIGTSGTQTTCFIAGIEGVTVSNKNYVTIDTTTGQLGSEARAIFSANLSAPQSNVTGDGTLYTVVCDNVLVNTGSAYNNTTGVFTAPVTGTYQFSATLTLLNIGALHGVAFFYVVNGSFGNVIGWNGNPFAVADSGQVTLNGSVSVHLTSGQTAAMKILVSGSTKTVQVYGVSGNETYFSGYLVG